MLVVEKRLVESKLKFAELITLVLYPYKPEEKDFVKDTKVNGVFWCHEHQFAIKAVDKGDNVVFHIGHWGSPMDGTKNPNDGYYKEFMEIEKAIAVIHKSIGVNFQPGW